MIEIMQNSKTATDLRQKELHSIKLQYHRYSAFSQLLVAVSSMLTVRAEGLEKV